MKFVIYTILLAIAAGLFGCGFLVKTAPAELVGKCEKPPKLDQDWVRVFCEDKGDVTGCGYIGTIDDQVCLAILESTQCGEWKLTARDCGVKFLVITPPAPESGASEPRP